MVYVQKLFSTGIIPHGCNESFITVIPKAKNPFLATYFRPVSLIGFQYKIIVKILATCLAKIMSGLVSEVQITFVKERQILEGPLMLNELIDWYKKKKLKLLIFKVDFEKTYDILSWEYVDNVMDALGFGKGFVHVYRLPECRS